MKEKYTTIRILAALVAIFIFVVVYIATLKIFFTKEIQITVYDEHIEVEKINTYICYVTRTGKCYHSQRCQYIGKSSTETTVYEAEQNGYSACSRCTPRSEATLEVERVIKTPRDDIKIQRNYIAPAIVSSVLSISYYAIVVISYRKKQNNTHS